MKEYIFISPGSDTSRQMLADLENYKQDNFKFIEEPVTFNNRIQKKLFQLYFRLNAKINLPFKEIWNRFYPLSRMEFKKENEYYIILGNGVFNYYESKWLNELKKKNNLHYIVYFIDPLSGLTSEYMRKNIFSLETDYIYTFDYHDAKKINAIHTMNLFSKKEINKVKHVKETSVYFVGTNKKNRIEVLHKVWDKLNAEGIECKFNIVSVPEQQQTREGISYNQMLSYDAVLQGIQEYDCILELLQPGQTGVTLRYYEAIAYNKRLITNNALVKELPYYNPEYMYVFKDVETINVEWIKKKTEVDYNYDNEFSPINFLKEIRNRLQDAEKGE